MRTTTVAARFDIEPIDAIVVRAMTDDDVPSPIDLRDPTTAATWAAEADAKRPHRADVRRAIAARVARVGSRASVLELGAGPGLLAEEILASCDVERYVLFDFSPPMLALAKQRIGERPGVRYVLGDFLDPAWPATLEVPFDAVVTMQAVHELRHKRRAGTLYAQAREVLRPGGVLVVVDHEPTDPRPLCSTADEQLAAMTGAGFTQAALDARFEGLYLCSAVR